MGKSNRAVVSAAFPAPDFFSGEPVDLDVTRLMEQRKLWTGERIRAEAPRLYEAVLKLAARGVSQEETAEILGLSINTVRHITIAEAASVDGYKDRLDGKLRRVTMLTLDAMAEKLDDPAQRKEIFFKDLAIGVGIAIEKRELVSGGATQRVEVVEVPSAEAINDWIRSLPAAQAVEVPGMGLGEGGNDQMKAVTGGELGGSADSESAVSASIYSGECAAVTALGSSEGAADGSDGDSQAGGAGVERREVQSNHQFIPEARLGTNAPAPVASSAPDDARGAAAIPQPSISQTDL